MRCNGYLHLLILIDATILTRVPWRRPQSVKSTTSRCVCMRVCVCVYSVSRVNYYAHVRVCVWICVHVSLYVCTECLEYYLYAYVIIV